MNIRRKKFTMIELLVVIAIITVLASLLLPGLNMAKKAVCKVSCASKLKQLSYALQSYLDDNKEFFPAYGIYPKEGWDTDGNWYGILAYSYLNDKNAMKTCFTRMGAVDITAGSNYTEFIGPPPNITSRLGRKPKAHMAYCPAPTPNPPLAGGSIYAPTYGFNRAIMDFTTPTAPRDFFNLKMIRRPSMQLTFFDTWSGTVGKHGFGQSVYFQYPYTDNTFISTKSHGGVANFLFLDGHAKALTRSDLAARASVYINISAAGDLY